MPLQRNDRVSQNCIVGKPIMHRYQESLKGTLKDNLANGSSSNATSSADIEKQIKQIFQGIEEGPGSMMVMTFSVPIKSSVADMMMEEMTIRYFLSIYFEYKLGNELQLAQIVEVAIPVVAASISSISSWELPTSSLSISPALH